MFSVTSPPEHFLFCATSRFLARLKFYNRLTIVELIKHIAGKYLLWLLLLLLLFFRCAAKLQKPFNKRQTAGVITAITDTHVQTYMQVCMVQQHHHLFALSYIHIYKLYACT